MKKLMFIALIWSVFHYTGCASNPVRDYKDAQIAAIGNDRVIHQDPIPEQIPQWTTEEGIQGMNMVSVGVAEGDSDASPIYLNRAAMIDAESQLFQRAPHEYRESVQHAMEGMRIDQSHFQSIQTKLLRLSGVSGIHYPLDKSYCTKVARDNGDFIKVTRVCYQQAVILLDAMNKTIERTFQQYYGQANTAEFKKRLDHEINKIEGDKDASATQQTPTSNGSSNDSNTVLSSSQIRSE